MKRIFFAMLSMLLGVSVWAYDNVPATFKWTVGNEAAATVTSDAADGVNETKVKVGSSLSVTTSSSIACNPGNTMVLYNPSAKGLGTIPEAMIEYTVKMKKGITFTLTGLSYDAVKKGTTNAEYHWSYTVDGVESEKTLVDKDHLIRDNNTENNPPLHHSEEISATAGQIVTVRFYVSGFDAGKNFCLSNIQIEGLVNGEEEVRAFKDLKIEFRENPYQVLLPEDGNLPEGVTITGTSYNGGQHGVQGGTITVPVDGPVKFTFGACQYSKTDIEIKKNGEHFATFNNVAPCGEKAGSFEQFVTWTYNVEEAATLTFELGSQTYLPYFIAEACEFVPQVEVRYFDTDGKTLIGSEIVDGNSELVYLYGADDVTVAEGKAFRGWFNGTTTTATKVAEGLSLTEDLNLYARATNIEEVKLGAIFEYNLTKVYFYPEDHEAITMNGGYYHDGQHGWAFGQNQGFTIPVAGNAFIVLTLCEYGNDAAHWTVNDAADHLVGEESATSSADGGEISFRYTGDATRLNFYIAEKGENYLHKIKVYNIAQLPEKSAAGYFEVAPNDGAGLILAIQAAEAGDKIFLPKGTYDLGDACLTTISKSNISIIGESMDETIIKNTPDIYNEGIGTTATLLITGNNTYLQDLTLLNAMDYFAALAATGNGRAVCLQDKGSQTICKNVRMLSNQDTYYSNKVGGLKYFEDCEIHGTVDFICGDGSVYFKNNILVAEQRNANGGGADALTASNADAGDKGYVFNGCTVRYAENIEGTKPVVSFGRAWNNSPKCIFLNTFLDDSNGVLNMTKDASAPKDKIARWTLGAMNALPEKFGEYNTTGNPAMPASNNVTFVLGSAEKQMETILTADEAATFTIENTLGAWAATAQSDATQAQASWTDIDESAVYLAETLDGNRIKTGVELATEDLYYAPGAKLRKANARGGFGAPAIKGEEQAIDNTEAGVKAVKLIRDGHVVIVRDGKEYNVLGTQF